MAIGKVVLPIKSSDFPVRKPFFVTGLGAKSRVDPCESHPFCYSFLSGTFPPEKKTVIGQLFSNI